MKIFRTFAFALALTACLVLVVFVATRVDGQAQNTGTGTGKKVHKAAIINCFDGKFISLDGSDPKRTELYVSKHLTYYAFGDPNTKVIIQFDKSDPTCNDYSPTGQNRIEGQINSVGKAWVKQTNDVKAGMSGSDPNKVPCYSYTVTCHPMAYTDSSHDKTADPIIDVPH